MTTPPPTDVLVIGAGMAGAALSARLSAHGLRVVCLEQGRWISPTNTSTSPRSGSSNCGAAGAAARSCAPSRPTIPSTSPASMSY